VGQGRDVRFVDAVDDAGLSTLYQQAAIVAVPSVNVTCCGPRVAVSELLRLTAIEAMASGAAVASRLGGLPEVVVDGRTGYLVEPGDVTDLRRRLEGLLDDPDCAAAMVESGRRLVLERLTWEACARRCAATYRELVSWHERPCQRRILSRSV
jgi:glycosyltransferase involved in cell wall biosynthesis